MLQPLADLKGFVQDLGSHESYLIESEWAEVKMMVEVLQIPHAATIYFQKQDLILENAYFIGEKSCLNWRSWITIWLMLLPPPCNHAKSFYCGKRLSWQLFGQVVLVDLVVVTIYQYFLLILYLTQYW